MITEERIRAIEAAYEAMKSRGWGFSSNGQGFGDPSATWTIVGPWYEGLLITPWGVDPDPVEAVHKALEREKQEREKIK